MKRLDLKNYTITIKDQQGIARLTPYQFKDTLIGVLTHRSLGLNGLELLEISVVVDKIKNADVEVILTDDDHRKIIDILKRFRGFSDPDTQFVKRIFNCPEIPDDGSKIIKFSKN
jgi:hypothetical protein